MELFGFVCTVGASLIFQQWLRGSISGYNDSGHLRIKHNTALTASGQELTPPHSLTPWIGFFYTLSIQTSRNLIQRQTFVPGGRELVQGAASALAGDPGLPPQSCQLPSFPTELRRAKCCRLYKSLPTVNASMQHSLQGKHFPTSPWHIFKC